jgi:hypothetical protein
MTSRRKRSGATETFSVSLDPESKRALRALANRDFGGNLSALVSDFASEARRRMAAGEFLRKKGIRPLTIAEAERVERDIEHELAAARRRRRHRAA